MKNEIKEFIKSEERVLKIPMNSLDYYEDLLSNLGFIRDTEKGETNGWQIDFWEYFKSEVHGEVILSGSLWYGDFKLSKVDPNAK